MTDDIVISKEKLKTLLKAAHSAYQKEAKPPATVDSTWVDWYVNYVVEKLNKDSEAAPAPENAAATTGLPDTSTLEDPSASAAEEAKKATTEAASTKEGVNGKAAEVTTANSDSDKHETLVQGKSESEAAAAPPSKTEPDLGTLQVCPTCAHRNRPGVLLCENCGTNLLTGQQSGVGTRDLRAEPAAESAPDAVKAAAAARAVLEENHDAVKTAGTGSFSKEMYLRIEIDGGPDPIIIKPKSEDMILGRRDPTTGATPEVDLTAYAGYRMGVSRRHASLALENDQLNLWDLGSSNGTFINGTRLTPHQPNPLRDGDEVRLGQMVIHLFFQKNA